MIYFPVVSTRVLEISLLSSLHHCSVQWEFKHNFDPGGGNLNEPFFKSSNNARGGGVAQCNAFPLIDIISEYNFCPWTVSVP